MPWLADTLLAPRYLGWMLNGWAMTLWASLLVVLAATLAGFVLAALRTSHHRGLRALGTLYVSVFRNTPLLVQLFFWYFGAPRLLPAPVREWLFDAPPVHLGVLTVSWPTFEFLAAIVGMTLYSTAYVGEEIRAGIQGVSPVQRAAGAALGFTRAQTMRIIILPQALHIALPPLLGQYMNIIKNTSLAMAIGLTELSYTARQVEAESFRTFQAFGVATLFYVLTIAVLEVAGKHLHRRLVSAHGLSAGR